MKIKAHLREKDKEIFLKYIKQGKIIFEYGCGGSTYEMNEEKNIEKIYSVESNYGWIKKILSLLPENHKVEFIFNDFEVETKPWGYPGETCSIEKKIQYSNQLSFINETIDILFIDGRFRTACCLKSYDIIKDDCIIIFDDFLCRPYYHSVLDFFEIIDRTEENSMVILKKKKIPSPNKIILKELIEKYELDPR